MPKLRGRFENLPVMIQSFINRVCAQSGEKAFRPQDFVEFNTDYMNQSTKGRLPIELWSQNKAKEVVSNILGADGKPIVRDGNIDEPDLSEIPMKRLQK